jgi:Kef-type K+ transport system membrane component KefB
MQQLAHHEIVILLLQISIMLIIGRFLGEVAKKLKQPSVVGEIIAGLILGPTIFGYYFPEIFSELFPKQGHSPIALHGFTSVSVVLLLFIAGLEVELPIVLNHSKKSFLTSLFGISFAFTLGFFSAPLIADNFVSVPDDKRLIFALFMGTAMSITALPVIARTLMDLGIFKSPIGMLIISSAMIDDLVGWMIFSMILGMMNETTQNGLWFTIGATVFYAIFMLTIVRRLFDRFLPWINNHLSFPGGILSFALTMGFLGAAFTEYIGIHAIFGAFIVGIALGDSIHMSSKTKEIIHDFVSNIFAPLFFVSIGLKVNFVANFDLQLVLFILFLAFLGKTFGCTLGSYIGGFKFNEALAIGFGMNARGAMEIILATLALQAGMIDQKMFVALVIMAIVTSISSGYLIRLFLPDNLESDNEPNGVIIMGDNPLGHYIAKYLNAQKISVLITDPSKTRLANGKTDLTSFQGNILDKSVYERLDLSRYSKFLALSDDDDINLKACKTFSHLFGDNKVFRLITRKESHSASLSLDENILFRGVHWQYSSLQRIITKNPVISHISFDNEESLNKFIAFSNNKKRIIPLFIQHKGKGLEPVSSYAANIQDGDTLIYIDLHKDAIPKSVKPSVEKETISK